MPLYQIRCNKCSRSEEVYRSFARMDELPECCGESMERVISPVMVMGDIAPYKSMIDGSVIQSRSRHREHMKDHGCIEVGNEKMKSKPMTPPPGLTETLVRVANEKLRR